MQKEENKIQCTQAISHEAAEGKQHNKSPNVKTS